MTNRRTTAPGAPWDMPPEMQPGEKVALYNRKKNAAGHLKIISVSFLYVCPEIDVTGSSVGSLAAQLASVVRSCVGLGACLPRS